MGSEDEVEQSMDGLAVRRNGRSKATCELTSSIVPPRDIFPPRWASFLSALILHGCHAAAAGLFPGPANSVPSTHMRCIITANRRASATIAFFIPQRLAICIAQALSQDHFFNASCSELPHRA